MIDQSKSSTGNSKALVMQVWHGVLVAVVASAAAFLAIGTVLPVFRMPAELAALSGPAIAPKLEEINEYNRLNSIKNGVVAMVIVVSVLAFALAACESVLRRAVAWAIVGGIFAALIAGVVAMGAGLAGGLLHDKLAPTGNPPQSVVSPLMRTMLVQGVYFGLAGLGIGLGVGLATKPPRPIATCIGGCVAGGLLAALVYPITISVTMATASTEVLIPDHLGARMIWLLCGLGLMSIAATGLGKGKKDKEHEG